MWSGGGYGNVGGNGAKQTSEARIAGPVVNLSESMLTPQLGPTNPEQTDVSCMHRLLLGDTLDHVRAFAKPFQTDFKRLTTRVSGKTLCKRTPLTHRPQNEVQNQGPHNYSG